MLDFTMDGGVQKHRKQLAANAVGMRTDIMVELICQEAITTRKFEGCYENLFGNVNGFLVDVQIFKHESQESSLRQFGFEQVSRRSGDRRWNWFLCVCNNFYPSLICSPDLLLYIHLLYFGLRPKSGRQDLNLRLPGPKPGALARLSYAPIVILI